MLLRNFGDENRDSLNCFATATWFSTSEGVMKCKEVRKSFHSEFPYAYVLS